MNISSVADNLLVDSFPVLAVIFPKQLLRHNACIDVGKPFAILHVLDLREAAARLELDAASASVAPVPT